MQSLGTVISTAPPRVLSRLLISAQARLLLPETSRVCRLVRAPSEVSSVMLLPERSRLVSAIRLPSAVTLLMSLSARFSCCSAVSDCSSVRSDRPVLSRSSAVRFKRLAMVARSVSGLPDRSSSDSVLLFNNSFTLVRPASSRFNVSSAVSKLISFRSLNVTPLQVRPVTLLRLPLYASRLTSLPLSTKLQLTSLPCKNAGSAVSCWRGAGGLSLSSFPPPPPPPPQALRVENRIAALSAVSLGLYIMPVILVD